MGFFRQDSGRESGTREVIDSNHRYRNMSTTTLSTTTLPTFRPTTPSKSEMKMSIEDYLLTKDSNRSTSLRPAWPHPLQLQHAEELQMRLAPLSDDISAILGAYGLPEDTLFLPYHATKADYPGGDRKSVV